jgi:hypothetical protein
LPDCAVADPSRVIRINATVAEQLLFCAAEDDM